MVTVTTASKVLELAGMSSAHEVVMERFIRALKAAELPPDMVKRVLLKLLAGGT